MARRASWSNLFCTNIIIYFLATVCCYSINQFIRSIWHQFFSRNLSAQSCVIYYNVLLHSNAFHVIGVNVQMKDVINGCNVFPIKITALFCRKVWNRRRASWSSCAPLVPLKSLCLQETCQDLPQGIHTFPLRPFGPKLGNVSRFYVRQRRRKTYSRIV